MLRSLKPIRGYKILATDGTLGHVYDFYLDDQDWTIRYLIVETGRWLFGRRVLITPRALGKPDWATSQLPVALTRQQIKDSPDISTDLPVSRQQELELHDYYRWPAYWESYLENPATTPMIAPTPPPTIHYRKPVVEHSDTPNLRSAHEITGYHIAAQDGEIGHVDDLIVDDQHWKIRYWVIDTRNWLPGRKVLVAPDWILGIRWATREVSVNLSKNKIKHSPQYDPTAPVNRAYESALYDYYGRPCYWS